MAEAETQTPAATPAAPPPTPKPPTPAAAPEAPAAKPSAGGFYWGTGRRKTAVARVRIRPGEGKYLINKREVDHYFSEPRDRADVLSPLKLTQTEGRLDVFVNVQGGGYMGQAGAVKLGLARALKLYDPGLEPILRDNDLLTRDPRKVERKKPGQPGARKRFQFSKR